MGTSSTTNQDCEVAGSSPTSKLDEAANLARDHNEWIRQLTDRLSGMCNLLEGERPEKESNPVAVSALIQGTMNRLQDEQSKRHDQISLLETAINRLAGTGIV
jgi:hypothetical protein